MKDIDIIYILESKSIELYKIKKVLKEIGILEYVENKMKDIDI